MKTFLVVCLCLIMNACATTVSAPFVVGEDVATVTFIREYAPPTAWNLSIQIDGQEYASISNLNKEIPYSVQKFTWQISCPLTSSLFLQQQSHQCAFTTL